MGWFDKPDHVAAVHTLRFLGYTYKGGELWEAPVAKPSRVDESPRMEDVDMAFIMRMADIAQLTYGKMDAEGRRAFIGDESQWRRFAVRLHDERWVKMLHRRVGVEQLMLDAANGKRAIPDASELRAWALKLGGQGGR